jgi:uncharacterized protein YecE (DUF72 family)
MKRRHTRRRARVCVGTSGWSYDHWKGPFYPEDLPSSRMLEHYGRHFGCVEINSSFYRLPTEQALRQWVAAVPSDFVFAAKASRYITHMKRLRDPARSTAAFFERIRALGERLGPVLFQLPPRWKLDEERLSAFLEALDAPFRYVFELRDRRWLDERVYRLLERHRAAFCIYELDGFVSPKCVTTDFVYIRLHGPDGAYQGRYDAETLRGWAAEIRDWAAQGLSVYCYFDNDQAGYAAINAAELVRMVKGE